MASEERKAGDGKCKQTRRGPAPFASFEDVSDESSSPESKLTFQLPDIQEDSSKPTAAPQIEDNESAGPSMERGRSLSTSATQPGHNLQTPSTPRIDISRASSSSHHDSRDSSPEMALFTGKEKDQSKLELGFREDGALELRSSTEELYFMEPNTATSEKEVPRPPSRRSPQMFGSKIDEKQRHSRKDSQTSDIVLLSISGRTSRLSSIGSQGSAHSNISAQSNISHISIHSHVSAQSRLSVISGVSRSPSPHKMLLETSFCGPKPIENEPDVSAGVSEERLLEMAGLQAASEQKVEKTHQEIKPETQVTVKVEKAEPNVQEIAKTQQDVTKEEIPLGEIKQQKEKINQLKVQAAQNKIKTSENGQKLKVATHKSREPKKPEVYSSKNRNKNIIRIKLKPDSDEDEDDESEKTLINQDIVQKPKTLNLNDKNKKTAHNFSELVNRDEKGAKSITQLDRKPSLKNKGLSGPPKLTPNASPTPSKKLLHKDNDSRTPSPAGGNVSRKSSFCSLFKSKETITSPDSPSTSMLKRKSVAESSSRSRSKSRDRSTTPTSSTKIKGSVLSLFKTPKKGSSPNSRASSPVIQNVTQKTYTPQPTVVQKNAENLKYYADSKDGIIHIPLHTPPDEQPSTSQSSGTKSQDLDEIITHEEAMKKRPVASTSNVPTKLTKRTVLPDGSIIIPLHSPTEKIAEDMEPKIQKKKEISVSIENHNIKKGPMEAANEQIVPVTSNAVQGIPVTKIIVTSADEPMRKKEHVLFTTSVGSKEQIFSTQFSLTKTPSLTSEYSDMFPPSLESFQEAKEESRRHEPLLPETHITTVEQQLSIESTPSLPKSVSDMEQIFIHDVKDQSIPVQSEEPKAKPTEPLSIQDSHSVEDIPDSSESELSSEMGALKKSALQDIIAQSLGVEEAEKKGLVMTQDSFEDELPYVPTTLPQERSVALPIVPIKERQSTGMKMYPIDRPRSTTPIHPSCLEEYCSEEPKTPDNLKGDKLKISLPKDITEKHKNVPLRSKSPRRVSYGSSPKPWGEFAEKGVPSTPARKSSMQGDSEKQPELPPRAPVPKPQWINFEEVPERRKMPKRIQTIPRHSSDEADGVVYNYVNPEDCKCECHESARSGVEKEDDEEPLLDDTNEQDGLSMPVAEGIQAIGDRRSLISDSSLEHGCSHLGGDSHPSRHPSQQIGQPFTMDLDVRSNRSSIVSQDGATVQGPSSSRPTHRSP